MSEARLAKILAVYKAMNTDYAKAEKHFIHFFQAAWKVLEPATPLLLNWHHEVIAEHLQATLNGDIKRLIINVPPRYSKSLLVTVMFPAWAWLKDPTLRFINASYSADLATKHGVDRRVLMKSDWYQNAWKEKFQFSKEQDQKTEYVNNHRGHMVATGMLGTITGKGGDCLAAGTSVFTARGYIPIEDFVERLHQPDVLSYNTKRDLFEFKRVRAAKKTTAKDLVRIETSSGRTLKCTRDHLVFLPKHVDYRAAASLEEGDILMNQLREAEEIIKITYIFDEEQSVYDIQVEDNSNFFADGMLVHNCVIIDDPHNPKKAESDAERTSAIEAFDSTFVTRLDNKKTGRIIVVMQRLHHQDLTGHLLNKNEEGEDWVHLKLPAVAPEKKLITYPLSKKIKVFEEGEILHPEREGLPELNKMKIALGSYNYAGQYDQNPSPRAGGLFKKDYWRFYTNLPEKFDEMIQSWDLTFKDVTSADYVAGFVLGRTGAEIYILDVVHAQLSFGKTKQALINLSKKWPKTLKKLVENKANGPAIQNDLKSIIPGIVLEEPQGSKIERAAFVEPYFEAGNVLIPHPTIAQPWVKKLVDEAAAFPRGQHDDLVDAMTQGVRHLMQKSLDKLRALGSI